MVLSYINMNPPQVYTCSPSCTPLPPPSLNHPSGPSQCTSPKLGTFFLSFFLNFTLFYFTVLYWFCHTSTWIRQGCTWVPNPGTPFPSPSPYHFSGSSQCTSPKHPVSCIEPRLVICFLRDIIQVSMPFSQIIPPSASPTEFQSLLYISVGFFFFLLLLLLSHIQGYHYHLSKFHLYVLVYTVLVFFFLAYSTL